MMGNTTHVQNGLNTNELKLKIDSILQEVTKIFVSKEEILFLWKTIDSRFNYYLVKFWRIHLIIVVTDKN